MEHWKNLSLEDIEGEVWNACTVSENYLVSNFGRIKSLSRNIEVFKNRISTKKACIIKQRKNESGYLNSSLCINKKGVHLKPHRLVAFSFIPNPENKRTVNHKNGIKTDNRVENLEWHTHSENGLHSYKELGRVSGLIGMFGSKHQNSRPIVQLNIDGDFVSEFECFSQANRMYGYSRSNMVSVCRGKRKWAHGFRWMYKEDYEKLICNPKPV